MGSRPRGLIARLEPLLQQARPDLVLVPGDVNSTAAAALTAAKLGIPVGHIEAGLRSFDRSMPEEINRVVTDQLADLLFIHSPEARDHLAAEGRDTGDIHHVGNTMIDTLVALRSSIEAEGGGRPFGLDSRRFLVVTLHRPALVDGPLLVEAIVHLRSIAEVLDVVFPVHPRTRARIRTEGLVPALLEAASSRDSSVPELWDGHAADRIVEVLASLSDYRGCWRNRRGRPVIRAV